MPKAERIPVSQAAREKTVTRQRVHQALKEGHINGDWFGSIRTVVADTAYEAWSPDPKRRKGQLKRWGVTT